MHASKAVLTHLGSGNRKPIWKGFKTCPCACISIVFPSKVGDPQKYRCLSKFRQGDPKQEALIVEAHKSKAQALQIYDNSPSKTEGPEPSLWASQPSVIVTRRFKNRQTRTNGFQLRSVGFLTSAQCPLAPCVCKINSNHAKRKHMGLSGHGRVPM